MSRAEQPDPAATVTARRVVDLLPSRVAVAADESQWLLTLLRADDLRYIFEGSDDGENPH